MKKDLMNIEGTVANIMQKRLDEINFYGSLESAKASAINILKSEEIKQKDLAAKYIVEIGRMRNMSHFMSTIGTYLTGEKVYTGKKYAHDKQIMTKEELFKAHQNIVYYCYSRLYEDEFIEKSEDDLVQEGFLALWKACSFTMNH